MILDRFERGYPMAASAKRRSELTSDQINSQARVLILAYRAGLVGQEECFCEILELVQGKVLTTLRYFHGVGNEQERDEMFQEVMLRLVKSESKYDPDLPLLPWLYTIARNVKADFWTKNQRRRDAELSFTADPVKEAENQPTNKSKTGFGQIERR
jgi:DNA-directed RNA polymerase specialized sigma24 family protein